MSVSLDKINFDFFTPIPFPMTMHGEMVDELARSMGTYQTFSSIDLRMKKLSVLNGKIVIGKDKQIFNTHGIEAMYLMNQKRKIYAEFPIDKVFYHSSFLNENEDWPIAAGMLRVEDGRLLKINCHSGHFAPSIESVDLVVERLNEKGAQIKSKEVIEDSRSYTPIRRTPRSSPLQNRIVLEEKLIALGKNTTVLQPSPSPPLIQPNERTPSPSEILKPFAVRGFINQRLLKVIDLSRN